jgi:biopolymer transport protein TolR
VKRPFVVKRVGVLNADINMTPLVDVVLVLLIIFMVLSPLLEKDIRLALPSTEKVEDTTEVPPEQIIVKISAAGELTLNGEKIAPEAYVPSLTGKLSSRADKTVFVLAEDAANYARLVFALEGAKAAGATILGMATDAPTPP